MAQAIKQIPIEKFWSKLMIAGKSINNVPNFYLSESKNARIYDWGIWPRRWKQLLTSSSIGTKNRWGFTMWDKLYQITNSKIYEINETTGAQTEKATLWYDAMTDILVYWTDIALIVSDWQELRLFNWTTISTPQTIGTTTLTYTTLITSFTIWQTIFWMTSWAQWIVRSIDYTNKKVTIGTPLAWSGWNFAIWENIGSSLVVHIADWITAITYNAIKWWIIEYCRWYSFLAKDNILYISSPITPDSPSNAYNFSGTWTQTITYDTTINWLYSTLNGLYVFTEDKIEFLGANALQNVSWSATFISTPIWESNYPISNLCIAGAWDKIFYISQNLQVKSVNFTAWITSAQIGTISTRPVISIKELLNTFDITQPDIFACYNQNEENIQFHIRTSWSGFNDQVLVYDLINDTWNIDFNKNYNYVVKKDEKYYGFSDVNSSIYEDWIWYSDAWVAIPFRIVTQNIIFGTALYKLFVWFFTSGWIWFLSDLKYTVNIDENIVFQQTIQGSKFWIWPLWEIWANPVWEIDIWGWPLYQSKLNPFDKIADQGRIFRNGKRINYIIESDSQIQDFIIDLLGTCLIPTNFTDLQNKF